MTEKQKQFADEYLKDLNATRAYKAIYKGIKSDDAAAVCASKLLKNANIKAYLKEQLDKMHDERTADAKEVLEYFTAVMRGQSLSEVVVVEGVGEGVSQARRMEKQPDEKERLKAAEMLGKYYALFTDKTQLDASALVQIVDDIK
jgi:phage terminase small subunit